MNVKAAETIHNSTMHLAQELLVNSSGAVGGLVVQEILQRR